MPHAPVAVVVVDDDEAVRQSLKFALELEGLHVRVYEGGAQLLAEGDFSERGCLVIDYVMPSMNGIELVDRLRRRNVRWPAILITTKPTPALRARAASVGVARIVEKPLEDGSLIEGIRDALAGGR